MLTVEDRCLHGWGAPPTISGKKAIPQVHLSLSGNRHRICRFFFAVGGCFGLFDRLLDLRLLFLNLLHLLFQLLLHGSVRIVEGHTLMMTRATHRTSFWGLNIYHRSERRQTAMEGRRKDTTFGVLERTLSTRACSTKSNWNRSWSL